MAKPLCATDDDIVREHVLRRVPGPPAESLKNPALRICLANCAELRKKQPHTDQLTPDGKRLAAGDFD